MHLVLYPIKQPRLEPYTSTQNPQKVAFFYFMYKELNTFYMSTP